MNKIILTSRLDTHTRLSDDTRVAHNFGNQNGILDAIASGVKKYENFLYVASDECAYAVTDMYVSLIKQSFEITLPFCNYEVLDGRKIGECESLIKNADLIILGGGHVPTQKAFFDKIHLKEYIHDTNAVICGISAGSMNSATRVYCPPELEGEGLDKDFVRYFDGLGLTDVNVFPHMNDMWEATLDGLRMIEDIVIPDTFFTPVLAIPDGSYVEIDNGKAVLRGEGWWLNKGKITSVVSGTIL